jgi:hypothetical protein
MVVLLQLRLLLVLTHQEIMAVVAEAEVVEEV